MHRIHGLIYRYGLPILKSLLIEKVSPINYFDFDTNHQITNNGHNGHTKVLYNWLQWQV